MSVHDTVQIPNMPVGHRSYTVRPAKGLHGIPPENSVTVSPDGQTITVEGPPMIPPRDIVVTGDSTPSFLHVFNTTEGMQHHAPEVLEWEDGLVPPPERFSSDHAALEDYAFRLNTPSTATVIEGVVKGNPKGPVIDAFIEGNRVRYGREVRETGVVWGSNANFLYGNGNNASSTAPVFGDAAKGAGDWDSIAISSSHCIAIKQGKVYTWRTGTTALGRVTSNTTVPGIVHSLEEWNFTHVAAGVNTSFAIREDGVMFVCGTNDGTTLHTLGVPPGIYASFTPLVVIDDETDEEVKWKLVETWEHTVAVDIEGRVWSWGWNTNFSTGLGISSGDTLVPTKVRLGLDPDPTEHLSGVVHLAVSFRCTICILEDGTVRAWGANAEGQLGLDHTTTPIAYPTLCPYNGFTVIRCGTNFSLGIKDGQVYGWGIVPPSDTATVTPTLMSDMDNFVQVYPGRNCLFAIQSNGTMWARGVNSGAELGTGVTSSSVSTLTQVVPTTVYENVSYKWLAVTRGSYSVALGRVDYVFDTLQAGIQLNNTALPLPLQKSISPEWFHFIIQIGDGNTGPSNTAQMWVNGELISELTRSQYMNDDYGGYPYIRFGNADFKWVAVYLGTHVGDVDAVSQHVLSGIQSIDGLVTDPPPAQPSIVTLSIGQHPLEASEHIRIPRLPSWHDTYIASPDAGSRPFPPGSTTRLSLDGQTLTVRGPTITPPVNMIVRGLTNTSFVRRFDTQGVDDLEWDEQGAPSFPPSNGFANLAGHAFKTQIPHTHEQALMIEASVRLSGTGTCLELVRSGRRITIERREKVRNAFWGTNANGQVGSGSSDLSNIVNPLTDNVWNDIQWDQVSAGPFHVIARLDGKVYTWGSTLYGALGRPSVSTFMPGLVTTLEDHNVIHVTAGRYVSFAITDTGILFASGSNSASGLPLSVSTFQAISITDPDTDLPVLWQKISTWDHTVAIDMNGGVWSWGTNSNFATGRATNVGSTTTPTKVLLGYQDPPIHMTDAIDVSTGRNSTICRMADGTIRAWGLNTVRQLNTRDTAAAKGFPFLLAIRDFDSIECGITYALGIKQGKVYAWGEFPGGSTTDQTVIIESGAASVHPGLNCFYVIMTDNTLLAMGPNNIGQLGNGVIGPTATHPIPTTTPMLPSKVQCLNITTSKIDQFYTCATVRTNSTTVRAGQHISDAYLPWPLRTDNNWVHVVLMINHQPGATREAYMWVNGNLLDDVDTCESYPEHTEEESYAVCGHADVKWCATYGEDAVAEQTVNHLLTRSAMDIPPTPSSFARVRIGMQPDTHDGTHIRPRQSSISWPPLPETKEEDTVSDTPTSIPIPTTQATQFTIQNPWHTRPAPLTAFVSGTMLVSALLSYWRVSRSQQQG